MALVSASRCSPLHVQPPATQLLRRRNLASLRSDRVILEAARRLSGRTRVLPFPVFLYKSVFIYCAILSGCVVCLISASLCTRFRSVCCWVTSPDIRLYFWFRKRKKVFNQNCRYCTFTSALSRNTQRGKFSERNLTLHSDYFLDAELLVANKGGKNSFSSCPRNLVFPSWLAGRRSLLVWPWLCSPQ